MGAAPREGKGGTAKSGEPVITRDMGTNARMATA
jgi:hypothetical protein